MNTLIELKNVSKEYKTGNLVVKAANNLNFTINKGELVVILGPSGSGKSTLLNLLGGLDKASSGEIIIGGENIVSFSDKKLTHYRAKEIGFIFQFYNLIPNLTACENIEILNDIVDENIDGKEILAQVGLAQHVNKFPSELSGGEQQRVSIARAIAKNPKMLLCDEPTGALDSNTGRVIIELLIDLCERENTTVIIVTHNSEFAKVANKVIHIKNGQVEYIEENETPQSVDAINW
ncbi:MAG: ABC transporter ATP-binding protein [Methanobrevibacter sp.]|uniref:ABC transporter ATP-binding protein n=1 Tax=Methanobrevibacter sp. TaxID=66852 RepID=UPI001B72F701|nr:ABC transporter ATP-binding protein [Methanobrevibacter sp.]MBP3226125.1 ABC transporter ATP-binding protein [Methanobrevibacter sp.]MBP3790425.1 ABC transporter ATP-binding protein [Methanobrevibacter sp.]